MPWWAWVLVGLAVALAAIAVHDVVQRRHAILRNFPVIGHLRFILEGVGPELRQYIVTDYLIVKQVPFPPPGPRTGEPGVAPDYAHLRKGARRTPRPPRGVPADLADRHRVLRLPR